MLKNDCPDRQVRVLDENAVIAGATIERFAGKAVPAAESGRCQPTVDAQLRHMKLEITFVTLDKVPVAGLELMFDRIDEAMRPPNPECFLPTEQAP